MALSIHERLKDLRVERGLTLEQLAEPTDTQAILGINDSQNVLHICERGTTFGAVRKGAYISVGVNIPPKDANMYGCLCFPIINSGPMAICLIRSNNYPLTPRERQFVKYLKIFCCTFDVGIGAYSNR